MLVNRQDAKGAKADGQGAEGNKEREEVDPWMVRVHINAAEEGFGGFIWRYGAMLGAGLLAVEEAGLMLIVSIKDCNHWRFDTRYGLVPPLGVAVWLACGVFAARKKWTMIASGLVLCVVVGLTVMVCDSFNLLVEYDRWLQRGLPDRWQTTP